MQHGRERSACSAARAVSTLTVSAPWQRWHEAIVRFMRLPLVAHTKPSVAAPRGDNANVNVSRMAIERANQRMLHLRRLRDGAASNESHAPHPCGAIYFRHGGVRPDVR